MLKIKIKKHHPDMPDLQKHGDWIDLYFCGIHPKNPTKFHEWRIFEGTYTFYQGETYLLSLGISVELPEGYEAIIAPRSSLSLRKGILLANGIGVIDNDYCGDDDIWGFVAYFSRHTYLKTFERIAQFRIIRNMPEIYLDYVEELNNKSRGGFGSSDMKEYKDGTVELKLGWASALNEEDNNGR